MSARTWTLAIHTPLESGATRLADYDINARAVDLRYTTRIDGGFEGLEVGLNTATGVLQGGDLADAPIDLPFKAHVELWDGDALLWEGRAGYREPADDGTRVAAFVSHGYMTALGDDWVRDNATTAITNGAALQYAIETHAPYLNIGTDEQFVLPTVDIPRGIAAIYKLSPALVADYVAKLGNSSNQLMDVAVWDGRTVWMQPRVVPATGPDYRLPFDRRYVHWSEDPSEMASEVTVEYSVTVEGVGGSVEFPLTTSAENTAFLDTWGFTRKLILPVGEMSSTEAEALRDQELESRSQPKVQATVFLEAGTLDMMRTASGAPRPFTLVRSGEWVTVGGKPAQPIIATTVDLTGMSATYELANPDPLLPKNQMRSERTAMQRFVALLNPVAGRLR